MQNANTKWVFLPPYIRVLYSTYSSLALCQQSGYLTRATTPQLIIVYDDHHQPPRPNQKLLTTHERRSYSHDYYQFSARIHGGGQRKLVTLKA